MSEKERGEKGKGKGVRGIMGGVKERKVRKMDGGGK